MHKPALPFGALYGLAVRSWFPARPAALYHCWPPPSASRKLEQLVYEARKAFEQYDAVDARNRLAASELERRWNGKLEEIEVVKQRLSSLETERYSLSPEEEIRIRSMGAQRHTARR